MTKNRYKYKYPLSLLTRKECQFRYNQKVYFIGGIGTVKDYCFDSGKWLYTIEMPLGIKLEMGRIGAETKIVLEEMEVQAIDFRKADSIRS